MKKYLTEAALERFRPPSEGRVEYGDTVVPGLMLRVTQNGVKSWSVLYKVKGEGGSSSKTGRPLKGKQKRVTLGAYPIMGVKKAREAAIEVLDKAMSGTDARLLRHKALEHRRSNTVEAVGRRYIEQDAKVNRSNWRQVERCLELHVFPGWGAKPIEDIRRRDVHDLLDGHVNRGQFGSAREVRSTITRLFNWAVEREIITETPVAGLKRKDLQFRREAGRALSDLELQAVWRAAKRLNYPFGPYFQLLILTGQRRNEWAHAKLAEICPKRKTFEIPKERYKGKRAHVVPLTTLAWDILQSMPTWAGRDPFLFSTESGEVPISGFSKVKRQLDAVALEELRAASGDKTASIPNFRIHDFRVTCESRLANLGFNQDIRDAVLGHAKVGLQRTYNKHDYADEKRAALEAYSKHVLGLVG